jgi:hypothetical protein
MKVRDKEKDKEITPLALLSSASSLWAAASLCGTPSLRLVLRSVVDMNICCLRKPAIKVSIEPP